MYSDERNPLPPSMEDEAADHDPEMKCPMCGGKGTQTLHGASFSMDEFMGPDWDDESRDAYVSGEYDHPCDHCHGSGVTTRGQWEFHQEQQAERRMGA